MGMKAGALGRWSDAFGIFVPNNANSDKVFSFIVLERLQGRRSDTFGGFRRTAVGAWLAAYVVTDWDDIGPGQGW